MGRAIKPRQAWKQRRNEPMLYADAIYRKFLENLEEVKRVQDPFLMMIEAGNLRDDIWLKTNVLTKDQYDYIDLKLEEIIETSAEEARRQIWRY